MVAAGAGRERRAVPRRAGIVRPRAARTEACECGKRGRPSRLRPGSDGPHGVPGRRPRAEPHQGRGHVAVRPAGTEGTAPAGGPREPRRDGPRPLEAAKKVGPREARESSKPLRAYGRQRLHRGVAGQRPRSRRRGQRGVSGTSSCHRPRRRRRGDLLALRPVTAGLGQRDRCLPQMRCVRRSRSRRQATPSGSAICTCRRCSTGSWRACAAASTRTTPNPCGLRKRGAPTMTGVAPRVLPAAPAGADGHDETVGTHHAAVVQDDLHGPLDQNRAVTGERHTRRRRFIVHVRHGSPPALPSPRPGI